LKILRKSSDIAKPDHRYGLPPSGHGDLATACYPFVRSGSEARIDCVAIEVAVRQSIIDLQEHEPGVRDQDQFGDPAVPANLGKMKMPNAIGEVPTSIVATTVLLAVAMTDTVLSNWFAT
jgi:hypothetical protein